MNPVLPFPDVISSALSDGLTLSAFVMMIVMKATVVLILGIVAAIIARRAGAASSPRLPRRGHGRDMAALPAGAMLRAVVIALEHLRKLGLDAGELEELLVQLVAALLAIPLQAILLARAAAPLDDKANGVGQALW